MNDRDLGADTAIVQESVGGATGHRVGDRLSDAMGNTALVRGLDLQGWGGGDPPKGRRIRVKTRDPSFGVSPDCWGRVKRMAVKPARTLARGDAFLSRARTLLVMFWWPLAAGVGLVGAVRGAARGPAVRSPSPATLGIMMGSIGLVRGGVLRCVLR